MKAPDRAVDLADLEASGPKLPAEVAFARTATAGAPKLACFVRDVREWRRVEKWSAICSTLAGRLRGTTGPQQAASMILELAYELFQWDSACVQLYTPAEDKLTPLLSFKMLDGRQRQTQPAGSSLKPSATARRVLKEGARLGNSKDPAGGLRGAVSAHEASRRPTSTMDAPIPSSRAVLGIVSIQSQTEAYSGDDLGLLQSLADHLGDALERLQMRDALQEAESKYRSFFENATEGMFQSTPDGRCCHANPALARLLGYQTPEELTTSVTDIEHQLYVTPERRQELKRLLEAYDSVQGFELENYRKDGSKIWVRLNAHVIRDAGGAILYYEGTLQDVTARKQAEAALRQSERRLRLISENTTDVIFAFDMDRRPIYANPAVKGLTGYTFAEIQEQGFINWIHPNDQHRMLKHWEDLYAGRGYSEVEFRLVTKAGQVKWAASTWGPLFDEQGCQIGVQGRERDITPLKQADATRREMAAIVENSEDAIFSKTLDGTIVSWNRAAEKIYGFAAAEVVGKPVAVLQPEDSMEELAKILQNISTGKRVEHYETVRRKKDGSLVEVALTISPIRDEGGKVVGASTITRDVTQHKRLEREVLEISANERRRIGNELHDGLGQFLAGIAFRAKALEQTLAAAALPQAQEAKELATLMGRAINQARSLARGLAPVEVEANGLVAALQNLAAETSHLFDIECAFHCPTPDLRAEPAASLELYRITQEAIHNACRHGQARRVEIELELNPRDLCLRVGDDGAGFDAQARNQAGMGLRVMEYRARSIGAALAITSEPGRGTEIRCRLPRTPNRPMPPEDRSKPGPARSAKHYKKAPSPHDRQTVVESV